MSNNYYLQNAQNDLVTDISNSGGVHSGSPLQALVQKAEANQYWATVDVPGKPGYFWIVSADQRVAAGFSGPPLSATTS
jgi:hypothetical protein